MSKRDTATPRTSERVSRLVDKLNASESPAFGTDPDAVAGPAPVESANSGTGNEAGNGSGTGSKRGPYAKKADKPAPLDIGGVALTLQFIHDAIANATGQPIWAIKAEEAEQLSRAGIGLMKAYSIVMTEKQQALSAMVVAVGAVYGPKIGALMVINSMRRNPAVIVPQPQPATDAPAMRMQ